MWAVAFASTSVIVGVIWDISWHRTIGRDTFWTAAHLAIYLGGAVAGLSCGWLVLATTFGGTGSINMATQTRFERAEGGSEMTGMAMGEATESTNTVTFPFVFPDPGPYWIFVQVKVGGTVQTAAFDLEVAES